MCDNSSGRPTDSALTTIHLLECDHHVKNMLSENTRSIEIIALYNVRIEKMGLA